MLSQLLNLFLLLLTYAARSHSYGYDSGSDEGACGRQYRSNRLFSPPCDLTGDGYCTNAGKSYPWHAVKRFVHENQGLMRRMYGDQSHGQILKAELDFDYDEVKNRKQYAKQKKEFFDFTLDNDVNNEPRLLKDDDINNDDVLNTKFVYSEEPTISIKIGDLRNVPHFRPTTQKTTTTTSETTTDSTTLESTTGEIIAETTETSKPSSTIEKGETVLFQDMIEDDKTKLQVNLQMRGVNACPVKEEVVAPFWANNTRGEVLALLNMYPFEQYVHWEKCTHEHRQMYCRDGCRCEQQYRLHRLLAYDPNNECRGIFSDWFRFPSCCVCKCYNITPAEFRVTSRSPRAYETIFPSEWYKRKNPPYFGNGDHG